MDAYEYSELLKLLNTKLNNIKGILKPDDLNQRLDEITQEESAQDFSLRLSVLARVQKLFIPLNKQAV